MESSHGFAIEQVEQQAAEALTTQTPASTPTIPISSLPFAITEPPNIELARRQVGLVPGNPLLDTATIRSLSSALESAKGVISQDKISQNQLQAAVSQLQVTVSQLQASVNAFKAGVASASVILGGALSSGQGAASSLMASAESAIAAAQVSAQASASAAIANVQSSASAALQSAQDNAFKSVSDAMAMARDASKTASAAMADASRARAEADSRITTAQGAAVSVSQAAIAVVAAVIGTSALSVAGFFLISRYRRNRLRKRQIEEQNSAAALDRAMMSYIGKGSLPSPTSPHPAIVYGFSGGYPGGYAFGSRPNTADKSAIPGQGVFQLSAPKGKRPAADGTNEKRHPLETVTEVSSRDSWSTDDSLKKEWRTSNWPFGLAR